MMAEETNRQLQILKVYVKDCSLECPNSPAIFNSSGNTQFKLNLDVTNDKVGDDQYEVVVTVTASATLDDKTLFLVEVHQAGVMQITGYGGTELEQILNIVAPTQLYPFAREVVGMLSAQAGFPQVLMPIVNFEQVWEQSKAAKAQPAGDGAQGATH
jgi:preprotein translocase subunit SecB